MLQLYYNGSYVPTGRSFSLVLKWANPACFFDSMPGDTGYGIDIPVNEYTRVIFGHPERFEKYRSGDSFSRTFPGCDIRFGGVLLVSGTLKITSATSLTYSGWLQSALGELGEAQKEKYISGLEWKETQSFSNKTLYIDGADDYCAAQLKNHSFWEGKGAAIKEEVDIEDEDGDPQTITEEINILTSQFRDNFEYLVNRSNIAGDVNTDGILPNSASKGCVVSPFLFLSYMVSEMLRLNKWFVNSSNNLLITDPSFINIFLYNNFNIFTQEYTYKEVEVQNFNWNTFEFESDLVIKIDGTAWSITTFNYADLIPRVALKDFIIGLQNYLNIVFRFRKDKKVDIIDRDSIISADAFDLDDYFLQEWMIGERKDLTLKFISEYDKDDSAMGDNWHDLSDRLTDFADTVDTKAELDAITTDALGTIRLVREENKYYEWKWTVAISEDESRVESQIDIMAWEFASTGPQPCFYGTGNVIEEIKTGISSLLMATTQKTNLMFEQEEITLPVAVQKGNIASMRSAWGNFSPRLLFYQGACDAGTGNIYSEAGPSFDAEKAMVLDWEGDYGLFEKRWKNWSRFWATRLPVEGTFDLPMNMLNYVAENITGVFRTRHGKFIIEEMETEFSGNLIGVTRIKGYKI